MSIEVNGHKVPPLLVKLIEEGKWINNQILPMIALNKMLTNFGLPVIELDMTMNSLETHRDWSKFGGNRENRLQMFEIYGLASSKELGHKIETEGLLDIDNAIFIAGNYDEEVICLDYRENPDNPRIMASLSPSWKWVMIAPNFETFARELGLAQ